MPHKFSKRVKLIKLDLILSNTLAENVYEVIARYCNRNNG